MRGVTEEGAQHMLEQHDKTKNGNEAAQHGQRRLQSTIDGLRVCSAAQNELIANLEEYERHILGVGCAEGDLPSGYPGSYGAELDYLHARRQALESLIGAVERYHAVTDGLTVGSGGVSRGAGASSVRT